MFENLFSNIRFLYQERLTKATLYAILVGTYSNIWKIIFLVRLLLYYYRSKKLFASSFLTTECPRSLDPIYVVTYYIRPTVYKNGEDLIDAQYVIHLRLRIPLSVDWPMALI